jgi:plasmid stabilization system protein ParE
MSIEYSPQAVLDIDTATEDIIDTLGLPVAATFQQRLMRTLTDLERMPYSGSPADPPPLAYPDLRFRPVYRFRARVVYYTPTPTGIRVVRVVHAHQDTAGLFD